MKLGIAGTGKIVQEALPVIKEVQPEKIVLMGRESSKDRAKKLSEEYELDGVVLDFDELLQMDLDTIYLALPNHLHFEFARRALRAGKHVIVEKPAAVHGAELKEMYEEAERQHRILIEAMSLHYLPAFASLKETVKELGEIKLVNFQFCQYSSRYDAFKQGVIAPAFDPACAGGALMDLNVYNLHAIVGLFGTPESVCYFPNMERGVDTSGILTMDYGNFRAVSLAAKDCQAPTGSTISGTNGCIRILVPANQIDRYELWNNSGESGLFDFSDEHHRLWWEWQEFSRMIREEDFAFARRMKAISLAVLRVVDDARDGTVS